MTCPVVIDHSINEPVLAIALLQYGVCGQPQVRLGHHSAHDRTALRILRRSAGERSRVSLGLVLVLS